MKKNKFSENDKKLKKFINNRDDISDSRIRFYDFVFDELFDLTGLTPSKIVDKCIEDQKLFLDNGIPSKKEMSDRFVDEIQSEYYDFVKNKKNRRGELPSKQTYKTKIDSFRLFLEKNDVELPDAPKIKIKKKPVRLSQLPTWSEVDTAIRYAKSPRDKAIIAFAATTGFRVSDITNFTIGDLIEACSIYFEENEEQTLENLLTKNPLNICPCWDIDPQKTEDKGNIAITFNTPETSVLIWEYLKYRIELNDRNGRGRIISEDEALFKSQTGNHLDPNTVEVMCSDINGKMGGEKDKNGIYGKFRIHNLRALFKTTCKINLKHVNADLDIPIGAEIVDLFLGHSRDALAYVYEAVPEDEANGYIRQVYEGLIPYLSISRKTEVNKFSSKEYQEFEEYKKDVDNEFKTREINYQRQIDDLTKENAIFREKLENVENSVKETSDKVNNLNAKKEGTKIKKLIRDYYYENHEKLDSRKACATWGLAYLFAMEDLSKFNGSNENLDSLIKRAEIRLRFHPEWIDKIYESCKDDETEQKIESENLFKAFRRIVVYLGKMDLWDMVKDNKKNFRQFISDYLLLSDYDLNDLSDEDIILISEDVMMKYFS